MENIRPNGFENESRDCTVRALSLASNLPYEKVHKAWELVGRREKHGIVAKRYMQKVCDILGIDAKQVRRSGTLNKLKAKFNKGKYFCLKRGHAFAVIDGVAHDVDGNVHIKGAWLITTKEQI